MPKGGIPYEQVLNHYLSKADIQIDTKKPPLGSGTYGTAFRVKGSSNLVIKVTKDKSEAEAAAHVKGKNLKNVYKVYRVFTIKSFNKQQPKNIYFIEQELLKDVDDDVLERLWYREIKLERKDKEPFYLDFQSYLEDRNYWKKSFPEHDLDKLFAAEGSFYRDLVNGANEIEKLGVDFDDFHSGNIMKRGGRYVIIDLGSSRARKKGKIDVIENIKKKVAEIFKTDI